MNDDIDQQARIEALEREVAELKQAKIPRGVRKRSARCFMGYPLFDIAIGPDPERNQIRGYARGIIAVGDVAMGVLSVGGVAFGLITVGGVAFGGISIGGTAIGVLLALGGLSLGGIAIGGVAIGVIAFGGAAIGVYAIGGGAFGKYVINASEQNPEAIRLLKQWIPGIDQLKFQRGHQ